MNRIKVTLCLLLLGFAAGCSNDPTPDEAATVITPEILSLEAEAEGGTFTIAYDIKNPIAGAPLVALTEADWITDIDTAEANSLSFTILCNDTAEVREATITLRYPSAASDPVITITQTATLVTQLTITLNDVDYSEATAVVSPQDAEMPYIVMMAEKSYFATAGIDDVLSLVDADETYFRTLMAEGDSLEEFLPKSNIERRGVTTQRWEGLSPAKEYVIYAYGIDVHDDSYRRITPVYHHIITSRLPERSDVLFDIDIQSKGPEVSITTTPHDWEGYYMVQFVEDTQAGFIPEGTPFSQEDEEALAESFFYVADHLYYFDELTADEVMCELGISGTHTTNATLNADHDYMVMVYAIASDRGNVPMVVSHPVVAYLHTGTVDRSDITFDVEITNIRPRSVDIAITPSCDDPYTAVVMYASNLPAGDSTEQLDYIVNHYAPLELTGPYAEHLDQLPPATDFVLAVYGFYAGAPTTDLFLYTFATAADGQGGNTITEVRCTAYDLTEVVALEPHYSNCLNYADYFLSIEVITAAPSPTLHFDVFPYSTIADAKSDTELEEVLEAIRESLLDYSYTSSPDWALCYYGNEYIVCGLAEDTAGYVGELFISEPIFFGREDVADAAEFVELYKEYVD